MDQLTYVMFCGAVAVLIVAPLYVIIGMWRTKRRARTRTRS